MSGHPFIEKLMFITQSAVPSARSLGLVSKLYPSNMPRMPNKDLPRFLQSLSRAHQDRGHERKALLSHKDVKLSFVSIRWAVKA